MHLALAGHPEQQQDKRQSGDARAGQDHLAALRAYRRHLDRQDAEAPEAALRRSGGEGEADGHAEERLVLQQALFGDAGAGQLYARKGVALLHGDPQRLLERLAQADGAAAPAREDDAADGRRLGLGLVVVERPPDLLDQERRPGGDDLGRTGFEVVR